MDLFNGWFTINRSRGPLILFKWENVPTRRHVKAIRVSILTFRWLIMFYSGKIRQIGVN